MRDGLTSSSLNADFWQGTTSFQEETSSKDTFRVKMMVSQISMTISHLSWPLSWLVSYILQQVVVYQMLFVGMAA